MAEAYPANLPLPSPEYSFELEELFFRGVGNRVKNSSGTKPGKLVCEVSVAWNFTPSEFATFETFFATTLLNGVKPFTIDLELGNGSENVLVKIREAKKNSSGDAVLNRKVTAKLICESYPLVAEAALDAFLSA